MANGTKGDVWATFTLHDSDGQVVDKPLELNRTEFEGLLKLAKRERMKPEDYLRKLLRDAGHKVN